MSRRRAIWIGIAAGGALLVSGLAWHGRPWINVWTAPLVEKKGEEGGQAFCDRAVSYGERSIPPLISSLRDHGPWYRTYAYIPVALGRLGEPAHVALRKAISEETDAHARFNLIAALQQGFADFEFSGMVEEDLKQDRLSRKDKRLWQTEKLRRKVKAT